MSGLRTLLLTSVLLALCGVSGTSAQTVQGRVLDEADDQPVATSLIRLVDADGEERGISIADSTGTYRIEVPGPGEYRLQAERIGFEGLETPLLALENPDGVYPVDLLVRRAPIPIEGFEITTEVSHEQADVRIRQAVGISPASMRWGPIRWEELQDHAERAHDLTQMMRWGNYAGMVVQRTPEGPCYSLRNRGCLDVYLNGFRLHPHMIDAVPLDMLHTVVVIAPKETIVYGAGAVLLYTEAMMR